MKILSLQDLHLSDKNLNYFRQRELPYLLGGVKDVAKNIDLMVIPGDFFDKRYPTKHPVTKLGLHIMVVLMNMAQEYDFDIRVIRGTMLHDGDMFPVMKHLENVPESRIKLYDEITVEKIKGLTFRFIPEPYMNSYQEFKNKLKAVVDVTVFHGTMSRAIPFINKDEEDGIKMLQRAIIMKEEDIYDSTSIVSFGGHIHTYKKVFSDVIYGPAFINKTFADSGVRGMMLVDIDVNNKSYKINIIENRNAIQFKSMDISDLLSKDMDDVIETLNSVKIRIQPNEKIRLKMEVVSDDTKGLLVAHTVKQLFNNVFSFLIKVIPKDNIESAELSELIKESEKITDDNIPMGDKIKTLIKEEYERDDITVEEINSIIY